MEKFEIHITGDSSEIIDQFKDLSIKTLEVELLDKEKNIVGKEYMCSHQVSLKNFEECKNYVQFQLLMNLTCNILRIKIETPYYEHYVDQSLYAEVHFPTTDGQLPTVRNVSSNKLISTERTYKKSEYNSLQAKYMNVEKAEFELCLYDSNMSFDDKWLSYYKSTIPQYKIFGKERRQLKKKLSLLNSILKSYWRDHQLEHDLADYYGGQEGFPMSDEQAKIRYKEIEKEKEDLEKILNEPFS